MLLPALRLQKNLIPVWLFLPILLKILVSLGLRRLFSRSVFRGTQWIKPCRTLRNFGSPISVLFKSQLSPAERFAQPLLAQLWALCSRCLLLPFVGARSVAVSYNFVFLKHPETFVCLYNLKFSRCYTCKPVLLCVRVLLGPSAASRSPIQHNCLVIEVDFS